MLMYFSNNILPLFQCCLKLQLFAFSRTVKWWFVHALEKKDPSITMCVDKVYSLYDRDHVEKDSYSLAGRGPEQEDSVGYPLYRQW